jgi:hypothetical protein
VSYLQLAHNERHPVTGVPTAKVIHSFGRAETVDRAGLARLVASISRFLGPEQAVAAAGGAEVEVVDSRRLGGAWVLDRVWERLGIGAAIRRVAATRKVDGELAERVVFALVAQRALEPGSKLAGTRWVAQRVFIEGLPAFSDDQAYRAMDFLLDALGEIAAEVFASVAHLLNLDCDIVSSTPPPPTGSSTSPTNSPTPCARKPATMSSPAPPSRPRARSGTPRTTAATCRRW